MLRYVVLAVICVCYDKMIVYGDKKENNGELYACFEWGIAGDLYLLCASFFTTPQGPTSNQDSMEERAYPHHYSPVLPCSKELALDSA